MHRESDAERERVIRWIQVVGGEVIRPIQSGDEERGGERR
jgi:hypothetical protein